MFNTSCCISSAYIRPLYLIIYCSFTGVTCTKSVEVHVGGRRFHFLRGLDLAVDSKNITDSEYNANGITITNVGLFRHLVANSLGLKVMWDGGKSLWKVI